MPDFRDVLNSNVTRGIAIGVGVVAAGWLLAPALRPAARAALKNGLLLAELGREKIAEAGEAFEDLVAEVRAELSEERLSGETMADVVSESSMASDAAADG